MPTLTSLPLSLLSRILSHLCDLEGLKSHSKLRYTNDYIPNRHPTVEISLDGVRTVNSPFPSELLAPALASPVLASAAQRLVHGRMSYLTDLNTEARLPWWVNAFSEYVKAIAIIDAGKEWRDGLSRDVRKMMEEKLCWEAIELFRTISVKVVRLKVLDVVNVPFDKCGSMEDEMMSGLCVTLETCQSTLEELALPVYTASNLCSRALATVTLPYLTVFSIERRDVVKLGRLTSDDALSYNLKLLDMMQAVDGHADRLKGLTSLKELRLMNLNLVPCTKAKESGCSAGFFRAIKTLRLSREYCSLDRYPPYYDPLFCSLFRKLECVYHAGSAIDLSLMFMSKRLREVHLCHLISRTGVRSVCHRHEDRGSYPFLVYDSITSSDWRIRSLVGCSVDSRHLRSVQEYCLNLQYLSLQVSTENMNEFGKLLKKCPRIATLEILVTVSHETDKSMGSDEWQKLGRLIPGHTNLRELEIRVRVLSGRRARAVRIAELVDCLVGIIKRVGRSVERLSFRLSAKLRTIKQAVDALCRILDCCAHHARVLTHLDVDISQKGRYRRYSRFLPAEEWLGTLEGPTRLRLSTERLIESQPCLNKIDLGEWQTFLEV